MPPETLKLKKKCLNDKSWYFDLFLQKYLCYKLTIMSKTEFHAISWKLPCFVVHHRCYSYAAISKQKSVEKQRESQILAWQWLQTLKWSANVATLCSIWQVMPERNTYANNLWVLKIEEYCFIIVLNSVVLEKELSKASALHHLAFLTKTFFHKLPIKLRTAHEMWL